MSKHMKQGKIAIEILIVLIILVFTTALILFFNKSGLIEIEEGEKVDFLNADFLPLGSSVILEINSFDFCQSIDENFNCNPQTDFKFGQEIHFLINVKTSVAGRDIIIIENYNLKDPNGAIIYSSVADGDYVVEQASLGSIEIIPIADYFTLTYGSEGEYTLEIIIDNPLLNKRTTLQQIFEVTN